MSPISNMGGGHCVGLRHRSCLGQVDVDHDACRDIHHCFRTKKIMNAQQLHYACVMKPPKNRVPSTTTLNNALHPLHWEFITPI